MKKILLLFIVCVSVSFISCNNDEEKTITKETSQTEDEEVDEEVEEEAPQLLNGITLKTKGGVKVYRAILSFEDGSLVPKSNKVQPGQKVKMVISVTEGWEEDNGTVSLGVAEKAVTSEGDVLLDAEDLFENKPTISADNAKFITVSITLPELEQVYDHYKISFRVWDKNGKGEITGSYKLYM